MNYKTRSLTALAFVAVAGSAMAQETISIPGTFNVVGYYYDPANVTTGVIATNPTSYVMSRTVVGIASGTWTRVNATANPSQTRIRLKNSAYTDGFIDVPVSTSTLSVASLTLPANASLTIAGSLFGSVIPAGSTWTAEFLSTVGDPFVPTAPLAGTDAQVTNVVINTFATTALPTNVLQTVDVVAANGGPMNVFNLTPGAPVLNSIATVADNVPPTSTFTLTNMLVDSATLTKPATTPSFASNCYVQVKHSANPALFANIQAFGSGLQRNWTSLGTGNKAYGFGSTGLLNQVLTGGGNYTFETYFSAGLSSDTVQDASWTNLKIKLMGAAIPAPEGTYSISGPVDSVDTPGDPDNTTATLGTTTTGITLSSSAEFLGSGTQANLTAQLQSAKIRFYNSAYPFAYAELSNTSTSTAAFNFLNQYAGYLSIGGLAGKSIPAGSTWSAEFAEDFDDSTLATQVEIDNDGVAAKTWNTMTFKPSNAAYVPAATPTPTVDLGVTSGGTYTAALPNFTASAAKWVKFTVPTIDRANSQYVDIWSQANAVGPTGRVTDTIIGLFDSQGRLMQQDDDDSFGWNSCLTYGLGGADSRAPKTTTSGDVESNSKIFNGRDGKGLAAGDYYVGVINWSGTGGFGTGYFAGGTGAAAADGTNLKIQVGSGKVSGTVTLQDWVPTDLTGRVVTYSLVDGSSVTQQSGTVTLDAAGNYSILTACPTGSYTLYMKASHWLNSGQSITVGGAVSQNFSLINGDVNDDNFVGFDDFDILSAAFNLSLGDPGYDANADLNGDDFVGFDDFDILSANFNTSGD